MIASARPATWSLAKIAEVWLPTVFVASPSPLWRIIPVWASIALIVSQPLHFIAYVVLQVQLLDGLAWGLTALGFTACALVIARTPDNDWDLPPASA